MNKMNSNFQGGCDMQFRVAALTLDVGCIWIHQYFLDGFSENKGALETYDHNTTNICTTAFFLSEMKAVSIGSVMQSKLLSSGVNSTGEISD